MGIVFNSPLPPIFVMGGLGGRHVPGEEDDQEDFYKTLGTLFTDVLCYLEWLNESLNK